jgi:hypothetical protein
LISTITVGTNSVNLVAFPKSIGMNAMTFDATDAVATVVSPFTGQTQTYSWPGADLMTGQVTVPPLTRSQAAEWVSFLLELRGMQNAFQLGDPSYTGPAGLVGGDPVVDNTVTVNAVASQVLHTRGWTPSRYRVLMPGDYIQVGYRLHRVLDQVNADSTGTAAISVWPSLRDAPTDGQQIILNKPKGLWRLASNKRTWNIDLPSISHLSFNIMEYR